MCCLLLVYWTFLCTSLCSRGKRESLLFGTTPPTNKQYARPCLHGSRNSSDLIWTHPHFDMWIVNMTCLPTLAWGIPLTVFTLPWTLLHYRTTVFLRWNEKSCGVWTHIARLQSENQELLDFPNSGCCIESVYNSCHWFKVLLFMFYVWLVCRIVKCVQVVFFKWYCHTGHGYILF